MKNHLGRLVWLLGAAAATTLAYVLLLGWNEKKELTPEEPGAVGMECTGPHEPWQVASLGVVLAAVVVFGAWRRQEHVVPATCVLTVTVLFAVDAATVDDPCSDDSLLALGVVLLGVGATVAATVLTVVTVAIRNRRLGA